jgi:hypothetical protein
MMLRLSHGEGFESLPQVTPVVVPTFHVKVLSAAVAAAALAGQCGIKPIGDDP